MYKSAMRQKMTPHPAQAYSIVIGGTGNSTSLWILAIWQSRPIFEKNFLMATKYNGPWLLKRPGKSEFPLHGFHQFNTVKWKGRNSMPKTEILYLELEDKHRSWVVCALHFCIINYYMWKIRLRNMNNVTIENKGPF